MTLLVSNPSRILTSAVAGSPVAKVIAPTNALAKIIYDKARVDRVENEVSKYIISADLSTTDFGSANVKVCSDYKLDVKLKCKSKSRYWPDEQKSYYIISCINS
ncbi:MAG: hypothetical protein MZV63_26745 [Marinilabiliales bacterium]|nr:hypothetical protein [Marinilabiliales bacterium]